MQIENAKSEILMSGEVKFEKRIPIFSSSPFPSITPSPVSLSHLRLSFKKLSNIV